MDFLDIFPERLKESRISRGFRSQESFAKEVERLFKKYIEEHPNESLSKDDKPKYGKGEIPRTSVVSWESKETKAFPGTARLIAIADALDVSIDYLLGRTDKKEMNK